MAVTSTQSPRPPPVVPPLGTPLPQAEGLATAIVEEVDPIFGRVKVRFPWDRMGEGASAWLRVAQPPGRKNEAFLPEPDDEVLADFLEGDADQPVVIGRMWNGKDRPPQP